MDRYREAELRAATQSHYLMNATMKTTQVIQELTLFLQMNGMFDEADTLADAWLDQMSATKGYVAAWSHWINEVVKK